MLTLKPTEKELESTVIPKTSWYAKLAERMGEAAVRDRLAREEILRTRMAPLFRNVNGMADRRLPVRVLDFLVRTSGFSRRARRNFLDVQLVEQDWEIGGLPAGLEGFRLLQVSDLHLDFDPGLVGRLREVVRGVRYDAVCLTGDFFDLVFESEAIDHGLLAELVGLFSAPIYAVLGNHDILAVAEELENLGVRVLMNESERLGEGPQSLLLAGVDDPRHYESHSFERALGGAVHDRPVVLMAHAPQIFPEAAAWGVDLLLCGHTHGGQICLPGKVPLSSRFKCPRRMVSGRWHHLGLQGYTSNGCGGCKLPYRLNSPAEVTVHNLRRRNQPG